MDRYGIDPSGEPLVRGTGKVLGRMGRKPKAAHVVLTTGLLLLAGSPAMAGALRAEITGKVSAWTTSGRTGIYVSDDACDSDSVYAKHKVKNGSAGTLHNKSGCGTSASKTVSSPVTNLKGVQGRLGVA
jgi:hypothetical protein